MFILVPVLLIGGVLKLAVELHDRTNQKKLRPYKFEKGDVVSVPPIYRFRPLYFVSIPSRLKKLHKAHLGRPVKVIGRHKSDSGTIWYELDQFPSEDNQWPESYLKLEFSNP